MKIDELVEVSQDREAWRELVVTCVDLQPPDERKREREREIVYYCDQPSILSNNIDTGWSEVSRRQTDGPSLASPCILTTAVITGTHLTSLAKYIRQTCLASVIVVELASL